MVAINELTIKEVEADIKKNETKFNQTEIDKRVEEAVQARLAEIEKAKAEAIAKSTEAAKEKELAEKLAAVDNKQKELEKQMENISLRRSIPTPGIEGQPQKKSWKEMTGVEKTPHIKQYFQQVTGYNL